MRSSALTQAKLQSVYGMKNEQRTEENGEQTNKTRDLVRKNQKYLRIEGMEKNERFVHSFVALYSLANRCDYVLSTQKYQ